MEFRIKDTTLAKEGKNRIEWAEAHMPVLVALRQKYEKTKPLKGLSRLPAPSCHGVAAIH
jgi:adenosylhomocysteinase